MERLCNAPLTTCNAHRTTGKPSHAPIWRAVHGVQCGRAKVAPLRLFARALTLVIWNRRVA